MQCNIDAKGKFVRLVWGLIMLALAGGLAALIALGVLTGGWLWWTGVAVLGLMGAFGIYEARAGWCVARAMGVKTKW
jgi:hypothetical protein